MTIVFPFVDPIELPVWLALPLALATAILGVGRLTRLITYDDYPPTIWLRARWIKLTKAGGWSKLATCFWCAAPWLLLPCIAWAWLTQLNWTWWLFFGWMGVSYLISMVVARDEPPE
jgi:hypothetical protein